MFFVVHALDHDNAVEKRLEHYEAHKAYLASSEIKTIISGPLLSDDGETMIGSLFVVEAASKDQVIDFNRADPFSKAKVWKQVQVHRFNKRVDIR